MDRAEKDDIPGYVIKEVANDPEMQNAIVAAGGPDLLDVTPQEADDWLKQDQLKNEEEAQKREDAEREQGTENNPPSQDPVWGNQGTEVNDNTFYQSVAASFMASADNAHAVHPNHPEYADSQDRPVLNGGIVVKHHANQKYTTDAVTEAVFTEICRGAGVPVQHYSNRADLRGGTTLGNISTAHVSVDSVDIGLAQLAMHSCYETAGALDTDYMIRASRAYFGCGFRRTAEGIAL